MGIWEIVVKLASHSWKILVIQLILCKWAKLSAAVPAIKVVVLNNKVSEFNIFFPIPIYCKVFLRMAS